MIAAPVHGATRREAALLALLAAAEAGRDQPDPSLIALAALADLVAVLAPDLRGRLQLPAGAPVTPLYQFLGSHNPYHAGHRAMLRSLAATIHSGATLAVTTMGVNQVKGLTMDDYRARHGCVVRGLRQMPTLATCVVTAVDLPSGIGLSRDTLAHSLLLAAIAGDDTVRVVMGSDKFVADAAILARGAGEPRVPRLLTKYDDPGRHYTVVVRTDEDEETVTRLADRHRHRYASRIDVIVSIADRLGLSSSRIRALRASLDLHDAALADQLQYGDVDSKGELVRSTDPLTGRQPRLGEDRIGPDDDAALSWHELEHGDVGNVVAGHHDPFEGHVEQLADSSQGVVLAHPRGDRDVAVSGADAPSPGDQHRGSVPGQPVGELGD
jgi:hypothetical protein